MRGALVPVLMTAMAGPACAQKTRVGDIVINQPWTRATPARTGAAYLDISNTGTVADRLVAVSTPVAAQVEMHSMSMTGGVMRMREVKAGILVQAGGHVRLAPGGLHLMLTGLKAPLVQGAQVPLSLHFARAGTVQVSAKVAAAGSRTAGGDHAGH